MASKKSIFLRKVQVPDFGPALIPLTDKAVEIINKINGDCEVDIFQYRNLKFHRKLFGVANKCVDNGILDRIDAINPLVMESLKRRFNDDTYTLIYIAKWLFLPMEVELLPDGKSIEKVSSISFREMDNVEFNVFYDKCVGFFADSLGVPRETLEKESSHFSA